MAATLELITGIIGWIILIILLVLALVFPTILNIILSAFISYKLSKNNLFIAIPLFVLISVLLSFNVRTFDLMHDYFSKDIKPVSKVIRKIEVHPSEKVLIKTNEEKIYYRADTSVKGWGLHADWQPGLYEIPMIVENPKRIIRELGIATANKGKHRISIEAGTKVLNGKVHIKIIIRDENGIAAEYLHVARRNLGIDNLDYRGRQIEKWRGYFSLITQRTPWNWGVSYYPEKYSPISEFLSNVLSIKVHTPTKEKSKNEPTYSLPYINKKTYLTVKSYKDINGVEVLPEITYTCEGNDKGFNYRARGGSDFLTIYWNDKDYPPLLIKLDSFKRRYYWSNVTSCKDNTVVLSTLMPPDNAMILVYEIDGHTRTANLKNWLQIPFKNERSTKEIKNRFYFISLAEKDYEFLYVKYIKNNKGAKRYLPLSGRKIYATLGLSKPGEILSAAKTKDTKAIVEELLESGVWSNQFYRNVSDAEPQWLKVADKLAPVASGEASGYLNKALITASTKKPYIVLPILQKMWWHKPGSTCIFEYEGLFPNGIETYIEKLELALKTKPPQNLKKLRLSCLVGLAEMKRRIVEDSE